MKKKLIASILAALMVTSMVPASAFANVAVPAAETVISVSHATAKDLADGVDAIPSEGYVAVADKANVKAVLNAVENEASPTVRNEFKATYPDKADKLTKTVAKLKTLLVNEASTALTKVTVVEAGDFNTNSTDVYKALALYDALNEKDGILGNLQNDLSKASSDKVDALNSLKTGGTYASNVTTLEGLAAANLTSDGADSTTSYNDATKYADNKKSIDAFYENDAYKKLPAAQRDLLKCVDTVDKAANAVEKFEKEDEAIKTELNKLDDLKLDTADRIASAKTVLAAVEAALEDVNTDLNNYKNHTVKVAGETTDPKGATNIIKAVKGAIKKAEKALKKEQGIEAAKDALKPLYDKANTEDGLAVSDLAAVYGALYTGLVADVHGGDDIDLAAAATKVRGAMVTAVKAQIEKDPKVFEQAVMDQLMSFDRPTVATLKTLHKPVNMYRWYLLDIAKVSDQLTGWSPSQEYNDAKTLADANVKYYETLGKAEEATLTTPGETDQTKQGLVQKVQTLVTQVETNADVNAYFERDLAAAKSAYAALSDYAKSLEIDGSYYYGDFTKYDQENYQVDAKLDGKTAEKVSITDAFAYIDKLVAGEDANKKAKDDADRIAIAIEALPGVTVTTGTDGKTTASITDFSKLTKEAVYKVKDMYDAASKEAKAYFKTGADYSTWKDALDKAVKAIDGTVVKDLNDSIAALTIVKEDAPAADVAAAKKANKEARDAYNALTDSQKAEVNITKLERAEAAVAAAELYAVKEQLKEIAKLDFDKLTKEDAAKIEAAKAAVDALTDAQKASLKDTADYKTFTEKALPALAALYDLSKATVTVTADAVYNGKAQKADTIKVVDALGNEVDPKEYAVTYENNKDAGEATVIVQALKSSKYDGTNNTAKFTIARADIAKVATITPVTKSYTGKAVYQPNTIVTVKGEALDRETEFGMVHKNNVSIKNNAQVTITGKGNYTGKIVKTFKIVPKNVKGNFTLKAGKKALTVKVNKLTGSVKYQYAYRVKGTTTWKYKYSSKNTITIGSLKAGKTYEVKARGYKGTTAAGTFVASTYGNVKTVKVK